MAPFLSILQAGDLGRSHLQMKREPSSSPSIRVPLCLILLLLLAYLSSLVIADTRVVNATALYYFRRSDCLVGHIPNEKGSHALDSLTIPSTTTMCKRGNGVTRTSSSPTTPITPSKTMSVVYKEASPSRGLSLEIWVRLEKNLTTSTTPRTILTLYNGTSGSNYLRLAQVKHQISLYHTRRGVTTTKDFVPTKGNSTYFHYVVTSRAATANTSDMTIYFDGEAKATLTKVPYINLINSASKLYLTSESTTFTTTAFRGDLALVAIYNRTLSAKEVMRNYNAKLLNSRPVVSNRTVKIQQNGEVGTHYNTPSFYTKPVPVLQLANITLPVYDVEYEDPGHPNYNHSAPPKVYIASLPHKGHLYQVDGTLISKPHTLVTHKNHTIRYRPDWDQTSSSSTTPYANFIYYAIDGVTGKQSEQNGTVSVVVYARHTFPKAYSSNATTRAGTTVIITFNGTASDGSHLASASILQWPRYGELHRVRSNGTISPRALTPTSKALNTTKNGTLQVAYVYTGPQNATYTIDTTTSTTTTMVTNSSTNSTTSTNATSTSTNVTTTSTSISRYYHYGATILGNDSFAFRLWDSYGAPSLDNATIGVTLTPSLMTLPSKGNTTEETALTLRLRGYDYQGNVVGVGPSRRTLYFNITTLPSHGLLSDPTTGTNITQVGYIVKSGLVAADHNRGLGIKYLPEKDWFSHPYTSFTGVPLGNRPDQFCYRVVVPAPAASGSGISESYHLAAWAPQEACCVIEVYNVHDPVTWEIPQRAYNINALGDIDPGVVSDMITLRSVNITDRDLGVNPLVVHVTSSHGVIRLNPRQLDQADFTSIRYCHSASSWKCLGSGSDRSMVFVTTPMGLYHLLNGMTYVCTRTYLTDYVYITVYDGEGGGCIPASQLSTETVRRRGCIESRQNFTVYVKGSALIESIVRASKPQVPQSLYYSGYLMAAFLSSVTIIWVMRKSQKFVCKKCQKLRGKPRHKKPTKKKEAIVDSPISSTTNPMAMSPTTGRRGDPTAHLDVMPQQGGTTTSTTSGFRNQLKRASIGLRLRFGRSSLVKKSSGEEPAPEQQQQSPYPPPPPPYPSPTTTTSTTSTSPFRRAISRQSMIMQNRLATAARYMNDQARTNLSTFRGGGMGRGRGRKPDLTVDIPHYNHPGLGTTTTTTINAAEVMVEGFGNDVLSSPPPPTTTSPASKIFTVRNPMLGSLPSPQATDIPGSYATPWSPPPTSTTTGDDGGRKHYYKDGDCK